MRNPYARSLGWLIAAGLASSVIGQSSLSGQLSASHGNMSVLGKHETARPLHPAGAAAHMRSAGLPGAKRRAHGRPLNAEESAPASGALRGGPSNDNCSNATVLTVNAAGACPGAAVAGDNFGANHDGADPVCDATATQWEDVWYTFNSGSYTSVTIDITPGDIGDLLVEVLSGGCAGTSFQCDFTQTSYTITVAPSTDYWIRIASNNDFGFGGTFDICLSGSGGGATPANDECANATPIPSGTDCTPVQADMSGATQSLAPSTCSTFLSPTANDVWFTFTATGTSTTVGVGGFGDATTGLDPILEIYSGNCGALNSLGCIDTSLRGGIEALTVATTIGASYYYRIYYWDYGTPQTEFGYLTCVVGGDAGTAPVNDLCDDATVIAPGATCVPTQANMQGATQSLPPSNCSTFTSATANDVWWTFTATGTTTTVGVGGGGDALTGLDPILEIYSGNCGALNSLGCIDTSLRGGTEALTVATTIGATYYYRVYYWDYGTAQTVFDYATCVVSEGGGNTPPNDECTNVSPVNLNIGSSVVFVGDNTGATDTEQLGIPSVWHAFTITQCANITLDYCATDPAFANAFLSLFIGCPFTDFVPATSFETSSCGNTNVTIQYTNVPAGTYYYAVLTEAGSTGAYAIEVSATPCPPPSDYCDAGAVSLQFEKISNVTFANINNNSAGNAGYEDFTAVTASVVGGQSYPISVSISNGYATDQVLAWIDWDHNSVFDAGEIVMSSATGLGPHTGNVNVPLTATPGPTRMRVRLHDTYVGVDYQNTPNPTPCDTSTYGQVEDYTVDMIGIITGVDDANVPAWSVFPNPGNGDFTISFAGSSTKVTVEVLDMTGRLVHSEVRQFSSGTMEHFALAGSLATGSYTLRLTSDTIRDEERIIIR